MMEITDRYGKPVYEGCRLQDKAGTFYQVVETSYRRVGTNNFRWEVLCRKERDGAERWIEAGIIAQVCMKVFDPRGM